MNNTEMTLLEREIAKSVKVRERIAKTILDNYPVDREFADLIALEATNNAIGTDRLEKYNEEKALRKAKQDEEFAARKRKESIVEIAKTVGTVSGWLVGICIAIVILFYIVTGVHACATKSPYPRVYRPLPEHARFVDAERSSWQGNQVYGLSDNNNLCLVNYPTDTFAGKANAKTCVHPNKVESLNQALEKAVKEDYNGVVWNEPNGRGEVWTVERNNYRFIITGSQDEGFKDDSN